MKVRLFAAAVLFVSASFPAFAEDGKVVEKPVVSDTAESFKQQSDKVHEQMKPGGIYEHITANDKGRVEARLSDMQKIFDTHPGQRAADLPQSDKVALFNAQEEVNGILKHNDNNRLVCERRAPVGSNLPTTTCKPYGELMAERTNNQRALVDRTRQADAVMGATKKPPGGN
ncbi:MAG TPA: hypothetical protein VF132_04375 [Rudaea sp.]